MCPPPLVPGHHLLPLALLDARQRILGDKGDPAVLVVREAADEDGLLRVAHAADDIEQPGKAGGRVAAAVQA